MSRWKSWAAAAGLALAAVAPPARAVDIDPEADKILKAMSTYLAKTKAFSLNTDVVVEVVLETGEKLQLCSTQGLVVRRPSEFRIRVKGMVANADLAFDGKTLTLHSVERNAFVQFPVSGILDDAFRAYEYQTGLTAAGADLLFSDPYATLNQGIQSSAYIGTAYVGGVEAHHLAFRKSRVDWQIWIQAGDKPLPLKYVITTKWQTGSPQFEVILRDWNTSPEIKANQFVFSAPAGAKKLDAVPIGELEDFPIAKEKP